MTESRDSEQPPVQQIVCARGELLWELRKADVTWSAELTLLGGIDGWEATVLKDGERSFTQRFVLRADATVWTDAQLADIIAKSWTDRRPPATRSAAAEGLISKERTEDLHQLRGRVGEDAYRRIQFATWKRFSSKAPPLDEDGDLTPLALYGVWDTFISALREAAKR